MKLMIGITAWAPLRYESKAKILGQTLETLQKARTYPNSPGSELIIVDNDCENPKVKDVLDSAKQLPQTKVVRFSPQLGWPGSRNFMIAEFMKSECDRLVMMDQDIEILDPTWLQKIEWLHIHEPDLHAYHIIFTKRFWNGTGLLKRSKSSVEIADRFLGGCNIISKQVPKTIGGFNTKISTETGIFSDSEFGWRLRKSGLLDACGGQFVDPFHMDILHNNSDEESENAIVRKEESFSSHLEPYIQRVQEIESGINLHCAY